MKLAHAFDPATGTPLSETRLHATPSGANDHVTVPIRTPVEHAAVDVDWSKREGTLTNGEIRSDQQGLKGHFRRVHRAVRDEPVPKLDCAAVLAIKRLKAANEDEIDSFVWLALAERLAEKGYWVAWMLEHFLPRCPECESTLKFRKAVFRADSICASAPSVHGAVDDGIRTRTMWAYQNAFEATSFESPTSEEFEEYVEAFDPEFV